MGIEERGDNFFRRKAAQLRNLVEDLAAGARGAVRFVPRELGRSRNLHQFSRAPRHRAVGWAVLSWGAASFACVAALVVLGWLVGYVPSSSRHHTFWRSLRDTITKPSVSLPLAFLILVALSYFFRRARLAWLTRKPGQIQVPDFVVAGQIPTPTSQLTIAFRQRLARMRLEPSTAAPAAQAPSQFLDVLSASQASSSDIIKTLIALLQAASPPSAWRIDGVVAEQAGSPTSYRVSLQVCRLGVGGGKQVELTDADLDQAITRAADEATAAILPRTKLCRGPWASWRRCEMPGKLFGAYEDACQRELEHRYDEAAELYYEALGEDPMNLVIRLQLGQLQEKQHQSLEALATYTAMVDVADLANDHVGLYSRRAERERDRALRIAHYRRAVMLAEGSFLEQWSEDDHATDRGHERQRAALRDEIWPWLKDEMETSYQRLESRDGWASLTDEQRERSALADVAKREIKELKRDLPFSWRFLSGAPLTPRTLDLTRRCIELRTNTAGPVDVDELEKYVEKVITRSLLLPDPALRWQEQYTAACLFAIPLLTKAADDPDIPRLTEDAVGRLKAAAASADSSYVASRRDWVTSEDPDLAGLREQAQFKRFEAEYFPTSTPVVRPPRHAQTLAELRCTRDLLKDAARGWSGVWRSRASALSNGGHPDVEEWWSDEESAWGHVHDVALNYDSRARLGLKHAVGAWHLAYGLPLVEPVFNPYVERSVSNGDSDSDARAAEEIERIRRQLLSVAELLSRRKTLDTFHPFKHCETAGQIVHSDSNGPLAALHARLCAHQAAIWHTVYHWFGDGERRSDGDIRGLLKPELRRAAQLLTQMQNGSRRDY